MPIDEEFVKEVGLMKSDLNTLLQSSDYVSIMFLYWIQLIIY